MAWLLSDAGGDPQPIFDEALDLLEHGLGALDAAARAPSGNARSGGEAGPRRSLDMSGSSGFIGN
jgi:hypothetical protein